MDKTIKTESSYPEKLRSLLASFFLKKQKEAVSEEKKQLLSDIEEALSDLRYARNCFSAATDPEIIEACIYEIKSAESRYNFLIRKAKYVAERESKLSI